MSQNNKPGMFYFCADHPLKGDDVTIGALAITARTAETLSESLSKLGHKKTLTWDTLTNTNIKHASALLGEFARLMAENKAHFHLRFTSIQQVDIIHKMELSDRVKIAHLYYHLVLQRAFRFYVDKYDLHIRPENEHVIEIFEKMRVKIHKDCFDLYGTRYDPINTLELASADKNKISEMVSLCISAITMLRHKSKYLENLSAAQQILLDEFAAHVRTPDLFGNSGAMEQKFSIWNDAPSLEHTGFRGLF